MNARFDLGKPGPLRVLALILVLLASILSLSALFTSFEVTRIERAHPAIGRFAAVDGGKLHLIELGARNAQAVVLLHGAGVNLQDLNGALGPLLAQDYRVIAVDRPGHGWSDRPGGSADAMPARQARLIHQALSGMGISRPVLVAHSWSGALATAYGLEYPEEVAGLVLLGPVLYPWSVNRAAWYSSFALAALMEATTLGAAETSGPFFARTLALPFGKMLMWPSVRSAFAPQSPPVDYLQRTGNDLGLRPAEFIANSQDVDRLDLHLAAQAQRYHELRMPIVVLTGSLDGLAPLALHGQRLAAAAPRTKIVDLPGVGHMAHYAAPDRIREAVADVIELGLSVGKSDKSP